MINDILIALLVVASVGLVAAILLALASHFLRVKENEKVKELRQCLPGVNCGACGFAGCDDYANALANGKAKPNLCIPGGGETAAKIADVLGIKIEKPEDLVAFVKCNGNLEAAFKKADYSGVTTCKAASMLYGGPKACRYGCLGCGDCAAVCPVEAICIKDGIAHIDPRVCIGCGLCAKTCPKEIITLIPKDAKTVVMCNNKDKGVVCRKGCSNACIGCKKCELNCPEKAITVKNNCASIDYDKCTGCGKCAELCPMHCIKQL